MSIKSVLFFVSLIVSINAAAEQFYRAPSKIPAGLDIHTSGPVGVECASSKDIAIRVTRRTSSAGWITFAVDAEAPEYEPLGRFKSGKPSKNSSAQKAMNQYSGPVPAFICIPYRGFID